MATSNLTLAEGAVNELVTYLTANLPTWVAAVNTQWSTDGRNITIAAPATIAVAELALAPQAPCLLVIADDIEVGIEDPVRLNTWHRITLYLIETDADQEVLRRKLYRQWTALINCIIASRGALAQNAILWDTPLGHWGAVYVHDTVFYADAQMHIKLYMQETI